MNKQLVIYLYCNNPNIILIVVLLSYTYRTVYYYRYVNLVSIIQPHVMK